MSLKNLEKIGQLERHETNAEQMHRLLSSARRCLEDATQEAIYPESRLDAAYRAITHLSMTALWANGYRPSSRSGHHMTMIQSLVHSVDLNPDEMRVLDAFRVKRNAINYTGDDVDIGSVKACREAAEDLMRHILDWLADHRPDLLA
jgi:uncharacterized protein (UPF0332 family)